MKMKNLIKNVFHFGVMKLTDKFFDDVLQNNVTPFYLNQIYKIRDADVLLSKSDKICLFTTVPEQTKLCNVYTFYSISQNSLHRTSNSP